MGKIFIIFNCQQRTKNSEHCRESKNILCTARAYRELRALRNAGSNTMELSLHLCQLIKIIIWFLKNFTEPLAIFSKLVISSFLHLHEVKKGIAFSFSKWCALYAHACGEILKGSHSLQDRWIQLKTSSLWYNFQPNLSGWTVP
jgi:hypothetical protein